MRKGVRILEAPLVARGWMDAVASGWTDVSKKTPNYFP